MKCFQKELILQIGKWKRYIKGNILLGLIFLLESYLHNCEMQQLSRDIYCTIKNLHQYRTEYAFLVIRLNWRIKDNGDEGKGEAVYWSYTRLELTFHSQ